MSATLPPNAPASSSSASHLNGKNGDGEGSVKIEEEMEEGKKGKRVAYYYDSDVGNFSYGAGHPMKPHRMRMTHDLVTNYGLMGEMDVYRPIRATPLQLTRFHADEYIDLLSKVTPETVEEMTGNGTRCLTGEDCPAFEGVFEFCTISAGGSIGAAERLNSNTADIAINWAGGLHHAKKTEASGFCYVNDIVLGILDLLRQHPRVLYIDIDIHHGDGVEEAFYSTDRVLTASFHKFGDFFPGTGDVKDTGIKGGKNYAVNIPMRDGVNDQSFASIFEPVIEHIMEWYRPGAVVLQCGADSLAGDKLGCFNLSLQGHANCARFVKKFGLPMIVVGGGGYTAKNVSRTWTYETALMCGKELDSNLPYNHYLEYYGPRYKLEVLENNMDDQNTPEYLNNIKNKVIDNLRSMPFAPSVQMHSVPGMSVGQALGIKTIGQMADDDVDYDLDSRIQSIVRARQIGDALSDDEAGMDIDSDDDMAGSSVFPRSSGRGKRQGGLGYASIPGSRLSLTAYDRRMASQPVRESARRLGKKPAGQVLGGGYEAKFVAERGERGPAQPRKRRNFFKDETRPPMFPLGASVGGVNITGLPVPIGGRKGKVGVSGNGGDEMSVDGLPRSRVGSPMSVA